MRRRYEDSRFEGRGEGPGFEGRGFGGRGEGRPRREGFGPWGSGFGPGHHGGRGRGGRGRRIRRGNVRNAIIALLAERPMHGYEMIQELESRTGGIWRPSPGSVYPTLQLMEDEGLVTSEEQGGKKLFTLTESGRAAAEAQTVAPWDEVTQEAGESATHAREAIGQLVVAVHQVMSVGSTDQQERALQIVTDARRKLYGILAEDAE